MLKKLFFKLFIIFNFLIFTNSGVYACNKYPYETGLKIDKYKRNLVIKSTAEVKVFVDDSDEINDSFLEAENIAITNIAKYIHTNVDLKQNKNHLKKSLKNDPKEMQEINSLINFYNLESQINLSGINILNKCYKKNDYVRVTVIFDQLKLREVKNLKKILKSE